MPGETAAAHHCVVATNGGFFDQKTTRCIGNLVSDGALVQAGTHQNVQFGITAKHEFIVGYLSEADVESMTAAASVTQLIAGVGWLVRNGRNYVSESLRTEDMSVQDTGGNFASIVSARNAIAHDKDGRLMLVAIDGKSWDNGVDLNGMAEVLLKLGAVNAINLDGGGSETALVNGSLVSYPSDRCRWQAGGGHTWANRDARESDKVGCQRPVTSITCVHNLAYADAAAHSLTLAAAAEAEAARQAHATAHEGEQQQHQQQQQHQRSPDGLLDSVAAVDVAAVTASAAAAARRLDEMHETLVHWRTFGIVAAVVTLIAVAVAIMLCALYVRPGSPSGLHLIAGEFGGSAAAGGAAGGSDLQMRAAREQVQFRVDDGEHSDDELGSANEAYPVLDGGAAAVARAAVFGKERANVLAHSSSPMSPLSSSSSTMRTMQTLPSKAVAVVAVPLLRPPPSSAADPLALTAASSRNAASSIDEDADYIDLQRELAAIATEPSAAQRKKE